MTVPDTCPDCGSTLGGLGKCWGEGCSYDHRTDGRRVASEGAGEPEPATSKESPERASVALTLPWDVLPSDNLRTRRRGNADAQEYKRKREAMEAHMIDQVGPGRPIIPEGPVALELVFYPPDHRRRDCANLLKAIQDAGEGIIYSDDYQITKQSWGRRPPEGDGRCEFKAFQVQVEGEELE